MRNAWIVILFSVFAVACGSCGGAQHSPTPWSRGLDSSALEISVSTPEGEMPIFDFEGRRYLLGESGLPYTIRVHNRSQRRAEVVVSVDGRDVVSGQSADFRAQRGYVIDPGEQLAVEGFRQSLSSVARFEFSKVEDSYAARSGDATNVGVIGFAIFQESVPWREEWRQAPAPIAEPSADYAGGAPAAEARTADQKPGSAIGTAYGERTASSAQYVPFQRSGAAPDEVLALYYDNADGLEERGIVLPSKKDLEPPPRDPLPFPGSPTTNGFAPPPPVR